MRKNIYAVALLTIPIACASAQTAYLGLYMNESKIGYSAYTNRKMKWEGHRVVKTVTTTEMSVGLEGTALKLEIIGMTVCDAKTGKPLKMTFDTNSGGRHQNVVALFSPTSASVTVENNGAVTHRKLKIPKGGKVTDDPLESVLFPGRGLPITKKPLSFFVLDPTTVSFVKNTLEIRGLTKIKVKGREMAATWIHIIDPRAATDVYLDDKGATLEILGPLGITMIPESRKLAMAGVGNSKADLAIGTKITPEGSMATPGDLTRLKLQVTSAGSLDSVASDEHETVSKSGEDYIFDVHPPKVEVPSGSTIKEAEQGHLAWIKPDLNIPSSSPRFRKLARQIVGSTKDVSTAAFKIQKYVNRRMQPDASIGVLRDANEVLDSCRGVCRDYAILTATLMRAAGIPTKLATGLVSWDGDFYYHAWVEIYNGIHWVGVDSTTNEAQISAAHVKLAGGTVQAAFMAPFLQSPKVKVLSSSS